MRRIGPIDIHGWTFSMTEYDDRKDRIVFTKGGSQMVFIGTKKDFDELMGLFKNGEIKG